MEMETAGAILGHLVGIALILLCVCIVLALFLQSLAAVILWISWLLNGLDAFIQWLIKILDAFIRWSDARAARRPATRAIRPPARNARRKDPCLPTSQE
jgi:hypothetical protein